MNTQGQPSQPKAQRIPTPPVELVDREVEDLFSGNPVEKNDPVKEPIDDFIRSTGKSKIAVIVPMYGYFGDLPNNFLDAETLKPSVNRIQSFTHEWYTVIVAEASRMAKPVYDVLNGPYVGGNLRGVHMASGSTYPEYVSKGIEVALEETRAQYIIIVNPWEILQKNGIDSMVERINLNGHSPIVCGFDMHREIKWEAFDAYKTKQPREYASYKAKHMLSSDFMGMKRMVAEMCQMDTRFKTQPFADRDFFQQLASKNFDAVVSDRVPYFGMEVPWTGKLAKDPSDDRPVIVPEEWYQQDLQTFIRKWGFSPADIRVS